MTEYEIVSLRQRPDLKIAAADWFHKKWGVPAEAYLSCMEDYITGRNEYGWYTCMDNRNIIAGLGVIENDFHDRTDLTPNVCAVFTEETHRRKGIAGKLLEHVVADLKGHGLTPLYLVTDHVGFYERYGWEYLCMVRCEDGTSRMYIHH